MWDQAWLYLCMFCLSLFELVLRGTHRFRALRCFQPHASSPARYGRPRRASLFAPTLRYRNAFHLLLSPQRPPRQRLQRRIQLHRRVSRHCRYERRHQSVEKQQRAALEDAPGSRRLGMDSMALEEQHPARFGEWLHDLELEPAQRLRTARRARETVSM